MELARIFAQKLQDIFFPFVWPLGGFVSEPDVAAPVEKKVCKVPLDAPKQNDKNFFVTESLEILLAQKLVTFCKRLLGKRIC